MRLRIIAPIRMSGTVVSPLPGPALASARFMACLAWLYGESIILDIHVTAVDPRISKGRRSTGRPTSTADHADLTLTDI